jgi:hypothetical protein
LKDSHRSRVHVSAKTAFATAGASGGTPASTMPPLDCGDPLAREVAHAKLAGALPHAIHLHGAGAAQSDAAAMPRARPLCRRGRTPGAVAQP